MKSENENSTDVKPWGGWFDATKVFPPFNKKVLGYYTIQSTYGKRKRPGEIHEYYAVIMYKSAIENENGKSALWVDANYHQVEPLFWCYLPSPPNFP